MDEGSKSIFVGLNFTGTFPGTDHGVLENKKVPFSEHPGT